MGTEASVGQRASGMGRWSVGLVLGAWAVTFAIVAVRYANTGRLGPQGAFIALMGVGSLLGLASHVPQKRGVRWLIRAGAILTIAGAFYVSLRGAG